MPLVDHLEELRQRVLRSLLAVVIGAGVSLVAVKPLVRMLEAPAQGIHFLQLAPGEFLFVSFKVAGYTGLTLALPYILFQVLAFVLPDSPCVSDALSPLQSPDQRCCSLQDWCSRGGL